MHLNNLGKRPRYEQFFYIYVLFDILFFIVFAVIKMGHVLRLVVCIKTVSVIVNNCNSSGRISVERERLPSHFSEDSPSGVIDHVSILVL